MFYTSNHKSQTADVTHAHVPILLLCDVTFRYSRICHKFLLQSIRILGSIYQKKFVRMILHVCRTIQSYVDCEFQTPALDQELLSNWQITQDAHNNRMTVFCQSMVESGAGDVGTHISIHTHTDNWCHKWPCRLPVVVWRHILLLSARALFHLRTKLNSCHGTAVFLLCIPDTDSSFVW